MTCLFIPIFNLSYFSNPDVDEGQDWFLDAFGAAPHGMSDLQKVVLWFACEEVLRRIGQLIELFIPDECYDTRLMRARRQKVVRRIHRNMAHCARQEQMIDQQEHQGEEKNSLRDWVPKDKE